MSYIGNQPSSVAFLTDTFNGTGSQTAFTLSAAPATTSSIIVAVSGVLQDPSTYAVTGTTLNFSAAPPSGTGNISVRFLGIPASGVTTTAYRTVTEFTATSGQTTFTPPSYTVGFISVFRNGVLLGAADYTATNGTTVVLAVGATSGDLVTVESFNVSSVLNAIPASPASVGTSYLVDGSVTTAKLANASVSSVKLDTTGTANSSTYLRGDMAWSSLPASGKVLQVVNAQLTITASTSSTSLVDTGLTASITPSSSSNKVLVFISLNQISCSNASLALFSARRNSTFLARNAMGGSATTYDAFASGGGQSTDRQLTAGTLTYLDSPATTSSVTYKVQMANNGGGTAYLNRWALNTDAGGVSFITLMEIAA